MIVIYIKMIEEIKKALIQFNPLWIIRGGSKRRKQRLLGLKLKYRVMQNFNVLFSDKIRFWVKHSGVHFLPVLFIRLINNLKKTISKKEDNV